ncbi:cell division protein ZipA [Vreelandella aquamarina]|uniref:cell division protein ZipA C-terminal FtsZ-binding domain-containing protein n=1 Tax=Vreelandella aquamarina TaxID=77097 RepID=UPI0005CC6122|nr:cell division protein ZipA C-terminal FtsZ-binding domain-containing protein [Halomonas meridiana]KJD18716.1 cell division protein ZipA [Halomonas meridiana]
MELREWLIILGLALVSLIVVDGVRRLQRQRRVPRLDQAVKDLPTAKLEELDDEAKEAEINWELPNGGARVVKPADYSGLGQKPKLERQEHPGPSRVLYDFRRSFTKSSGKPKPAAAKPNKAEPAVQAATVNVSATADASAETRNEMREPPRREPSVFTAREEAPKAEAPQPATPEPSMSAMEDEAPQSQQTGTAPASFSATDEAPSEQPNTAELNASHTPEPHAELESNRAPEEPAAAEPDITPEPEPVLRAEPEDAVFAKHASDAPKRRQLRADMAGDHELDDDEIDEYRLVDFEGIGRSFKRRIIERRKEKAIKKAEKAKRAEAAAKQKVERKALEAEQRREAKQAAEAEKARIAQEKAQAREAAAANEAAAQRDAVQQAHAEPELERYANSASRYEDHYQSVDEEYDDAYAAQDNVVRAHPTLEKALRHDVNGEHAKETLANANELVVISVLSRDPEGFDGDKLLELMMACGLRYCRAMGVFNRFETESHNSELQFSMVNVLKPGTFPIEEMDEFVTPGITFLMPLPGAVDSSAAFEAMVETAMVVVRHMGGELKDENRSVMTAQTIEFARQRVHEFERRHRLHRHMQAR